MIFTSIVTVNENSKAKLFDIHSMSPPPVNASTTQNENVIEFVATFPKVAVNTGDSYRSCVITPNTMHPEEIKAIIINTISENPHLIDKGSNPTPRARLW